MKASANKAKASDPAEDFISTKSFKWQMRDRTKMWAMNEKSKVDMYEDYVAPGGFASLLFGRH